MLILKKIAVVLILAIALSFRVNASELSVSAKAAVLINGKSGEIIYSKNCDKKLSMASTTKIMTALILCEYGNFNKEVVVTAEMLKVEGSSMGLLPGDKVTLKDLLYGLMLSSGNDAANVIAFTIGGSLNGFVEIMNEKARELELTSTHFETPSGLDGENHYTTAYELALLTQYAMQNPEFKQAVATEKATLNYGDPPYKRTLKNHNKLLKTYEGAIGVKTGFTKKSGRCLVSAAERGGKFLIAVTLNASNDWQDHKTMLDYGFSAIKQTEYIPLTDSCSIPIINGKSESLTVNIESLTVNSVEIGNIECKIYLPQFLYAPINKGDIVGKAVYSMNGNVLAEKLFKAPIDIDTLPIKESVSDAIFYNFKAIFKYI